MNTPSLPLDEAAHAARRERRIEVCSRTCGGIFARRHAVLQGRRRSAPPGV